MIMDIGELYEFYRSFFLNYSGIVREIFVLVMIVLHGGFVKYCLSANKNDSVKVKEKLSHNTVNTAFWVMVILLIPFIGILLYIFCSIRVYSRWKKNFPDAISFPMSYKLYERQLQCLIFIGVVGKIADFVTNELNGKAYSLCFQMPFMLWVVMSAYDLAKAYRNRDIYIGLMNGESEEGHVYKQGKSIMGRKHMIEENADRDVKFRGRTSVEVRAAADSIISDFGELTETDQGVVNVKKRTVKFQVMHAEKYFGGDNRDVVDARYIGRGITRYVRMKWSTDENGEESCTDYVVFRISPKIRFVLIRSAITLFAVLTLFSHLFRMIHTGVMTFIDGIIR